MVKERLAAVRKYLPVSEQLASAGQPTLEQFHDVRDAGFEVIINLLPPERVEPWEESLVRDLGMAYVSIPVVWTSPTENDIYQFFAAMDEYKGRKIFVHCAVNMRASAFLFLYRVCRIGVDYDHAEADLHDLWIPEGCWAELLQTVQNQCGAAVNK